jgi:hypothetical protein
MSDTENMKHRPTVRKYLMRALAGTFFLPLCLCVAMPSWTWQHVRNLRFGCLYLIGSLGSRKRSEVRKLFGEPEEARGLGYWAYGIPSWDPLNVEGALIIHFADDGPDAQVSSYKLDESYGDPRNYD